MRYMGIDYGEKRVGIALSDESGRLAFPKKVLPRDKKLVSAIAAMCQEEKVGEVVIGESLDYKNQPNAIMKKIVPFKEELERLVKCKVTFEPEFMTSHESTHIQGDTGKNDASAAALILKSYLDKKNNY